MAFAVAVTLATPLASVTALGADRFALAPLPGAAKLTVTPGTGLLPASRTVTESGLAKAVLMVVLWGVDPGLAVTDAGAPTVLVSEKLTVVRPAAAAVTVYGPPATL